MKLRNMLPYRTFTLALAMLAPMTRADGSDGYESYCSSQNTGSSYAVVSHTWNSFGACGDQCRSQYAFAIMQFTQCWCSNYIPAQQVPVSNCSAPCPGYPDDQCGNIDEGLYGYLALTISPSGTAGAASTQYTSTSAQSVSIFIVHSSSALFPSATTPDGLQQLPAATTPLQVLVLTSTVLQVSIATLVPEPTSTGMHLLTAAASQSSTIPTSTPSEVSTTIVETVTQEPSLSVLVSYSYITPTPTTTTSSSVSSISSISSTDTSSPSSTTPSTISVAPVPVTSQTPVTSIQVVTLSGAVVTQYVTSTPMAASGDSKGQQSLQRKQGIDSGAIAGIVIGVILGVALLALAAFLLWRRRRKNSDDEKSTAAVGGNSSSPRRNASHLSKSGLIARARPETANDDDDPWAAATGENSTRHSMMFGAGAEVSPVSPLGSTGDNESRRHSRPYVFDPRLNPSALFAGHEANGSRVSMQDAEDYTRPLGVRNPDPPYRASFSSR